MKVKYLQSLRGTEGGVNKGDVREVPDAEAERLIAARVAEPFNDPVPALIEAAAKAAAEQAAEATASRVLADLIAAGVIKPKTPSKG